MRADGWNLRTWVLAAIAGGAVVVLLLALAGMGRRLPSTMPEQGAPLPNTASLPSADIGLQAREAYAVVAQRPLFSDNRQPQPFYIEGQGPAENDGGFDFVLSSVLLAGKTRLAILQPPEGGKSVRFKLGESAETSPDWRLVTLTSRSATFEGPDGIRTLDLRVFDGKGGERATQLQQYEGNGDGNGEGARAQQPPVQPPERRQPAADAPPTPIPAPAAQTSNSRPPQPPATSPAPSDEQVQAIRARIQQRRAELRREQQSSGNGN
ncbi:MAG: hypothetical protein ABW178_11980 [Pseudoxanthomonas sp.]